MGRESAALQRKRNSVTDERIYEGCGISYLQHAVVTKFWLMKNERRGSDGIHRSYPMPTAFQ